MATFSLVASVPQTLVIGLFCVLGWGLSLLQLLSADRNIKIKQCEAENFTAKSYSFRIDDEILLISIFRHKSQNFHGFELDPLPP